MCNWLIELFFNILRFLEHYLWQITCTKKADKCQDTLHCMFSYSKVTVYLYKFNRYIRIGLFSLSVFLLIDYFLLIMTFRKVISWNNIGLRTVTIFKMMYLLYFLFTFKNSRIEASFSETNYSASFYYKPPHKNLIGTNRKFVTTCLLNEHSSIHS